MPIQLTRMTASLQVTSRRRLWWASLTCGNRNNPRIILYLWPVA